VSTLDVSRRARAAPICVYKTLHRSRAGSTAGSQTTSWSGRGQVRWQTPVFEASKMFLPVSVWPLANPRLLYTGSIMATVVKAVYENGVFKPKEPLQLQERTEVEVLIPAQSPADDDQAGWAAARALIGFIDDAPANMAEHHDHSLYGRPRA
jgi:hypothetical protein